MNLLDTHVTLVARWVDAVDVGLAPARISVMQEENFAKDSGGLTAATGREIERTALHEASHAVIAHGLGLDVGRVCVRADASGSAAYTASEARADTLLSMVLADLAGIVAELLTGADHRRQFALANSHDILSARSSIEECQRLAPSWMLTSRSVAILTCCIVQSNLRQIERVAGALRLCRELDGGAVEALCGQLQ
jgi:hypothetical protein